MCYTQVMHMHGKRRMGYYYASTGVDGNYY
jgi:hypothetical protein